MNIRGFSDAPIGYPYHDRFMTEQFRLIIDPNISSTATDETQ
jgi:hypothetical protein